MHRHNFLSPQNWLCRSERNPALDTHGDNAYSPQIPDTKLTVTSKVQFLQLQHVFRQKCKKHNPSHVQQHTLPSQLLITQFRLNKHNFSTSLAAPKANPVFHAANKNLFIKIAILLLHPPLISHTLLARDLTNSARKQHNVNTHTLQPILANNKLSLATNKPTSPAKFILQKLWLQNGSPSLNNNNHYTQG